MIWYTIKGKMSLEYIANFLPLFGLLPCGDKEFTRHTFPMPGNFRSVYFYWHCDGYGLLTGNRRSHYSNIPSKTDIDMVASNIHGTVDHPFDRRRFLIYSKYVYGSIRR